ncbi:MAG: hypothetical protein MK100_00650 [Phycisphaerales bacterium]|nr:hypothetical protein [Phycisphaerales bacterium]
MNRTKANVWSGPWVPGVLLVMASIVWGLQVGESQVEATIDDRSAYMAVTARTGRGEEAVLWMLDTQTEELIAVGWEQRAKSMLPMGRRSVAADVQTAKRIR